MTNLSHQIYKFRLLYAAGWIAFLFTWWYAFSFGTWYLLLFSYLWARVVTFFGVQIALHRYFCHKAFVTTKIKHRMLLWFSLLSGEGSPIAWATHHRHHHKHSDQPLDLHSPHESKLLSMFLWQIKPLSWWLETKQLRSIPKDLLRDKEIKWFDHYYYTIWAVLVVVTVLIDWKITVFFLLAPVGWAMIHAMVGNFGSHWKLPGSYRNYDTPDYSHNNQWVAWYLGGEGLHNNHHQYPNAYDQAVTSKEFDFAGWVIKRFFNASV
jgi:fatty-acid desaturase